MKNSVPSIILFIIFAVLCVTLTLTHVNGVIWINVHIYLYFDRFCVNSFPKEMLWHISKESEFQFKNNIF